VTQGAEAQSADRARYELAELVETRAALASERDIKKLLSLILLKCRQVTGADAGSVYVLEEEGGSQAEYKPRRRSSSTSCCRRTTREGRLQGSDHGHRRQVDRRPGGLSKHPINIPDLTKLESTPKTKTLTHNRSFDDTTGYRARSMLTCRCCPQSAR
jgi:hypothetical protein